MCAMPINNYDYLFKFLLIGDSGVGKTSILFRFSDDTFTSSFISTIGIDFKIKTIKLEGKRIKLQIWDTAGHERFHSITTSYYRGAKGIILVYDITNENSFMHINRWLKNIDKYNDNHVEKMLLGNKCDMEYKRRIAKAEGEDLAQIYGFKFMETSAKCNINIAKAFTDLATYVFEFEKSSGKKSNIDITNANRKNNHRIFTRCHF